MGLDHVRRDGLLWLAACLLASSATSAAPAVSETDVEVFGGFGIFSSLLNGTYDASYTPPRVGGLDDLFVTPDPRSTARQVLALDGATGHGLGLGITVYPHRVLGLQLLFDRSSADLRGTNAPHTVDFVWDSIAFPSSERVIREFPFSFEARDTGGRLKTLTLSLNAVARWRPGPRVTGSLSAGATYFRIRAEDLRVGALAGFLGGHAVLTSILYEMSLDTAAAHKMGFNLGGDLSLALGSKVALFADGRFYYAPATAAPAELTGFVEEPLVDVPVDRIARYLALRAVDLDPRHLRLLVGLNWRP